MSYTISNFLNAGFGGSGSSGGFGSMLGGINLADYASIKNGTYYKLLKKHYSMNKTSDSDSTSSSSSSKRKSGNDIEYWDYNEKVKSKMRSTAISRDSAATLAEIRTDASDLTEASQKLLKTGSDSLFAEKTTTDANGNKTTGYNTDDVYKAVSSFVKGYNGLIQSAGQSKVAVITARRSSIMDYTRSNSELLASVGITVNAKDGALVMDEDQFKNADKDTVKKLFQGKQSYADKVSSAASGIGKSASYEATKASTYSRAGSYSSNYTSAWENYS